MEQPQFRREKGRILIIPKQNTNDCIFATKISATL
jgi:hypothetical protein